MKEGMRMRKLAIMALSVVLISVMAIGGSLAYFTDTVTNANNVITAGSVQIEQIELQRSDDGIALESYELNKPCYPAHALSDTSYTPSEQFYWGAYTSTEDDYNLLWNDDALSGVIDKFVFVKNIGASQAYCRTLIALECPDNVTYGTTYSESVDIMLNLNNEGIQWTTLADKITIDGTQYQVMVATYIDTVKAGETSMPSLLQVVMTDNATNREVLAMGDTYEILVMTQACQTTTFIDAENVADDAKAANALNKCFAEINTGTVTGWFNTVLHPEAATSEAATQSQELQ